MRVICRAIALSLSLLLATTAQADLLTNGNFEDGLNGWNQNFAANGTPAFGAQSGNDAAVLAVPGGDNVAEVSQFVAATAGQEFNFNGYIGYEGSLTSPQPFGLLKIVFRDINGTDLVPESVSIGNLIGGQFPGAETPQVNAGSTPDVWNFVETQAVAPTGTVEVGFFALNIDFSFSPGQQLYFDNLNASVVPEPTTSAILAIGCVALAVRRRRS